MNALMRVAERNANFTRGSAKANANPPIYATIRWYLVVITGLKVPESRAVSLQRYYYPIPRKGRKEAAEKPPINTRLLELRTNEL